MSFSSRLKEARKAKNLTQKQVATHLNCTTTAVYCYECEGKSHTDPSIAVIAKLLDLYEIDANYLFQDECQSFDNLVLSLGEKEAIVQYRKLTDNGKKAVETILQIEYNRDHGSFEDK